MPREILKTLFHPFDSGVLDMPGEAQKCLFLGAEAGFRAPDRFGATIEAVQPYRPHFNALLNADVDVFPESGDGPYDLTLIMLTKHRGENENRIVEALNKTVPGGYVVIAGAKDDGVQSLRKRLGSYVPDLGSMPKYHGVVVWFTRPDDVTNVIEKLEHPTVEIDGRFSTVPGLFSHDRIDQGSRVLSERLPADFSGLAADFGSGWGYLSAMLLDKAPRTAGIDLYEADFRAVERSKANLAPQKTASTLRYFWQDLVGERVKSRYDLVIMNPPFHAGKAAEPSLGKAMIKAAVDALKPSGKLLLVANRGLPYEPVLAEFCKKSGEDYRNARFKVLWGMK